METTETFADCWSDFEDLPEFATDCLRAIPSHTPAATISISMGRALRVRWFDADVSLLVHHDNPDRYEVMAPGTGIFTLHTRGQLIDFVLRSVISSDPRDAVLLRLEASLRNAGRVEDRVAAVIHAASELSGHTVSHG